ncbi:MAG: hypothetical protein AB7E24_24600, partial [Novosphingobium sp.]
IPAHRPQDHITLEMAPLEIRHRSVRPISAKHAQASRFLQQSPEDEDELLYRAFVPQADIDKMRAAGPVKRDYPLLSSPELEQVRKLMQVATMPVVELKSEGLNISLRREG